MPVGSQAATVESMGELTGLTHDNYKRAARRGARQSGKKYGRAMAEKKKQIAKVAKKKS